MGQRLVRTIDRGIKLCTDTLDYSSTKEDPPEFEDVRISFLLGEVAGDTLETFGSGPQKVSFKNNVASDTVVSADPDHTYRIFNNLFRNAAHAMSGVMHDKTERQLIVDASKEGDFVKVRVADTGPGIPEKAQDGLFKAFASANGAGSTGLGLTISKELATAQGGDLILEKTGKDGTTFLVSLKAG
jgi:signal transduction histidine kinase